MDCALQTPPQTTASTWAVAEYSCGVSRAVRLFIWPELVTSVRSHSPCSSALSRWRRGAAAPLLVTSLYAGSSGRGAYRRPAEPLVQSDSLATTDTRPLSVCPVRSPWVRACGPATRTLIRPAGALQRWFRRWTGIWGEWHDAWRGPELRVGWGVSSAGMSAPSGQHHGRQLQCFRIFYLFIYFCNRYFPSPRWFNFF